MNNNNRITNNLDSFYHKANASLKNYRYSPRKMRLIVDAIRGKEVYNALNILKFSKKKGALAIEKLLLSCISNWKMKNNYDVENIFLYISCIFVNSGKTLKRLRPVPQGRGHKIRKRSSHITIILKAKNKLHKQNGTKN